MADKIEEQLAESIEQDLGVKAMAAKLAPRLEPVSRPPPLNEMGQPQWKPGASASTVEGKLAAIERLIAEIRTISAQIKGQLG